MDGDVTMYWAGNNWPFDYGNLLSIASASYHAPRDVRVFVDKEPEDNPHWDRVRHLPHVQIRQFDPCKLDPPLFDRYQRVHYDANRSEVVCYSQLAEHGGLWLDADTLTVADLRDEPETLILRDPDTWVQEGVIGLPAEHPLALRMLDELAAIPQTDDARYAAGMECWRRVVGEAGFSDFGDLASYFPLHWTQWEQAFTAGGFTGDVSKIHIYHWFGYSSHGYTAQMDKDWFAAHPCLFSYLAAPIVERLEGGV